LLPKGSSFVAPLRVLLSFRVGRRRRNSDPAAAVVAAAQAEFAAAETRVFRERAMAALAGRPGVSWARVRPGQYVVARDGEDVGLVAAVRGHRRVRWEITPTGHARPQGIYSALDIAARALVLRAERREVDRSTH
jgi:hypothetical protein